MKHLTPSEYEALRRLAGRMIPSSERYGVPGADDPAIFERIATTLCEREVPLSGLLSAMSPGDLEEAALDEVASALGAADPDAYRAVLTALAQCYYRDDRVMRALGMEPRPPFPGGFEVAEGDWSVLEQVRRRPSLWRPV
ncbi:MAG TPA: hypothetical protein VJM34_18390 [Novosphingobium sp.]|nr:hypothetical protein [Novosphingobium sp.]